MGTLSTFLFGRVIGFKLSLKQLSRKELLGGVGREHACQWDFLREATSLYESTPESFI